MKKEIKQKFESIKGLIGNTPLVEIKYSFKGKIGKVFAKLEWYNLTGSIKDRVAYQILFDAYKFGHINSDSTVYEITSGNMGISLSAICNLLGNKCEILMPKNMSEERKKIITLYGAKLNLVENFDEGFKLCKKLEKQGKFIAHQFENESNFFAHYSTTGKEIYDKLKTRKLNAFVAGVGTSGTLSGVGTFLKEHKKLKVVGIEPQNAQILSKNPPYSKHKLQGLSDEILPKLYDEKLIDYIIQINDDDAIAMSQKLAKELSLGAGISSGANFLGCVLFGGNCATTFADSNKKYLSTDLSHPITTKLVDDIKLLSIKSL